MLRAWSRQQGDTIIEVMLAVAVLSMVAVGTLTVMTQGTQAAQRSLEVTLVKEQIDAQAEALRAAHSAYLSDEDTTTWPAIKAIGGGSGAIGTTCPSPSGFVMNTRTAKQHTTLNSWEGNSQPPYAQVQYDGANNITGAYGIWIESATRSDAAFKSVVDFTIRACWYGPGLSSPMTLSTLVRLYEP